MLQARTFIFARRAWLFLGILFATSFMLAPTLAQRPQLSLGGTWQFRKETDTGDWKSIQVPNSFEEHEGVEFDGVGIYQKQFKPLSFSKSERLLLRFHGSATHTEVWLNEKKLGQHLGGWTPFQFDITELIRSKPNEKHLLRVRVDEKVGHNSQGFLPIIAPHFGGIWQDVEQLVVPQTWIDPLRVMAIGNPESGALRLELPIQGAAADRTNEFEVSYRLLGKETWSEPQSFTGQSIGQGTHAVSAPIANWKVWSPDSPNLYEVKIRIATSSLPTEAANPQKPIVVRAAFRDIVVEDDRFLLNGEPTSIRGVLNWGYAPPRVSPSIDEEVFRDELKLARKYGFNLMKFCLWIPPKRYLEIADEMGMLTWIEYPTWHSQWTFDQLPKLEREYREFFQYDRNHPSVVLRSLTCETGPSADLEVIRTLYDLCHEMIPGSIVEDDSSWIQWNRVHDFYDDHPYGNNHTWVATLDRLKKYIRENGIKPLVLGEAISADTWIDIPGLLRTIGDNRPFWLPGFLEGNQKWLKSIQSTPGSDGLKQLKSDSEHYAMLMRKYQTETYRREVPNGGYVVSVIRDFPLAGMGLVDYLGREKWKANQWAWHGETMLLLETDSDRRSFFSGENLKGKILVSHFGKREINSGQLSLSITTPNNQARQFQSAKNVTVECGTVPSLLDLNIKLPVVNKPTRILIRTELTSDKKVWKNHWPIWVLPNPVSEPNVSVHPSINFDAKTLFASASPLTRMSKDEVILTSRLDSSLIDFMESGGRIMLIPDGQKGSLPLIDNWFLRGGPYVADHPLCDRFPREMLVELQHFDLASSVIPTINYLDQISPILLLWDNHDLDYVKTHGLVFETQVGAGRLFVSALKHRGQSNSAGKWLIQNFVKHLQMGPRPKTALAATTIERMRSKLREKKIDLTQSDWRFKPDPEIIGEKENWQNPEMIIDETWDSIKIGQHWESQGYEGLDGWAWYRTQMDIPADWKEQKIYASFEGVDDHYRFYLNGQLIGQGGVIESKETAFEERKSYDITEALKFGSTNQITIQVYDWYGAGGLFRPISIGSEKIDQPASILK